MRTGVVSVLLVLLVASTQAAEPPAMIGFASEQVAAELALEQRFDSQLQVSDLQAWLKQMSSQRNEVGAPHDKANAEFVQQQFKAWGWDSRIEVFQVLYPTLKSHRLELLGPAPFVASLREPAVEGDATSSLSAMESYGVYGADGDVTAELVYVNYGMPDDYLELQRRNVDVRGKIVIARYGGGWRGLKAKLAYQHGAVGCIIYSDPSDDGYAQGDVYTQGGWRPAQGIQRGSVGDMPVAPGDPLTPGWGATQSAKRLPIAESPAIMKIPVLPISYADAQPLLAALRGSVAPAAWRGALPITYHIGNGSAKVHMSVASEWSLKPAYDVIATIHGAQVPDEWVVRGNHRDAWVFGAWDPLSGHVAMMAEAKAIGGLLKQGWRPARTLVYASWDAEEPGMLGSVEWAETHADELQRKAVLYVNSDTNSRGFLMAASSTAMQRLVNEVADSVIDPQTGVSVRARLNARNMAAGVATNASALAKDTAAQARAGADFTLQVPGAGSDHIGFVHHLGIPTVIAEYGGEGDVGGVYHSAYDSFDHYTRFGDPGQVYGIAEAQTAGRLVLRTANATVLPMQFDSVAANMTRYVKELRELVDAKRQRAVMLMDALDKNVFALAADPLRPLAAPERVATVPVVDFNALEQVTTRLQQSAVDFAQASSSLNSMRLKPKQLTQINNLLRGLEQTLLQPQGLPERPWYRNYAYAPGLLTGYEAKTLPAVREAIENNAWAQVPGNMMLTAEAFNRYCDRLDQVIALMSSP